MESIIDVEKYRGIVKDSTPGKLEGERPETAYFYEAMLEGDGNFIAIGDGLTYFEVNENEKKAFNLYCPYFAIEIFSNGFVYGYQIEQDRLLYLIEEESKLEGACNE